MSADLGEPPAWMAAELSRRTGLPLPECGRMLASATLAEYKRVAGGHAPAYRVDPAEDDPQLATVLLRATLEADAELAGEDRDAMGFCHLYWHAKQRLLRHRYGVEWRTPAELNPQINFD
jgi:hypothetical protein